MAEPLQLHIYGQYAWHDDVQIVGTTDAIKALRDALTEALEKGKDAVAPFYCADGEGYGISVFVSDSDQWPKYTIPYSAEYAHDQHETLDPRYMPSRYRELDERSTS